MITFSGGASSLSTCTVVRPPYPRQETKGLTVITRYRVRFYVLKQRKMHLCGNVSSPACFNTETVKRTCVLQYSPLLGPLTINYLQITNYIFMLELLTCLSCYHRTFTTEASTQVYTNLN